MTRYLSSWSLNPSERRADRCTCPLSSSASVCRNTRASTSSRCVRLSPQSVPPPTYHVAVSPVHLSPQQLCLCVQEYQGQYTFNTHLAVSPVCSSTWPPVYLHTWLSHLSTWPPVHPHTCLSSCLLAHLYSCLSHLSVLPHLCKYAGVLWSEHLRGTPGCLTWLSIHLVLCLTCVSFTSLTCLGSPVSPAMLCMFTLYKD